MNENNIVQFSQMAKPALARKFFSEVYKTSGLYFLSNNDIRGLLSGDRFVLLRSAVDSVACLSGAWIWSQSQIYNHQAFLTVFVDFYGKDFLDRMQHAVKLIDADIILAKLSLSLFAFSNHIGMYSPSMTRTLTNASPIVQIQNSYAEITWKYLLYRYGHDQAVIRYTNLIQCLLVTIDMISIAQNNTRHTNDIESLVEQTELKLVLDDIERADYDIS